MMKWLEKLGFRKADEMDQHIHTTALGASWLVIVVCLLGWGVYGVIRQGTINVSLLVLSMGLAVYYGVMLWMRNRLYGSGEE